MKKLISKISIVGTVNNLKGNFAITLTKDGRDLIVKDGLFDVSTK